MYLNNASSPLTMKEYTEPSLYVKSNHSLIDVVPIVQNILPLTINKRCAMIIFPPSPSCEDCKSSKRKNELLTALENFQAKVTAEVDFLRTLPENDMQRKELIQSRHRRIKERNDEKQKYHGPPLLRQWPTEGRETTKGID